MLDKQGKASKSLQLLENSGPHFYAYVIIIGVIWLKCFMLQVLISTLILFTQFSESFLTIAMMEIHFYCKIQKTVNNRNIYGTIIVLQGEGYHA